MFLILIPLIVINTILKINDNSKLEIHPYFFFVIAILHIFLLILIRKFYFNCLLILKTGQMTSKQISNFIVHDEWIT